MRQRSHPIIFLSPLHHEIVGVQNDHGVEVFQVMDLFMVLIKKRELNWYVYFINPVL